MDKNSPQFKKLKDEWYAKAKDSGFNDIEQDEDHLKSWASKPFKEKDPVFNKAKEDYFRLAGQFLNQYDFKTDLQRQIWHLHSEGESYRTIARMLRTSSNKLNKDSVQAAVESVAKEMINKCP